MMGIEVPDHALLLRGDAFAYSMLGKGSTNDY
jgi:hypothetical protein